MDGSDRVLTFLHAALECAVCTQHACLHFQERWFLEINTLAACAIFLLVYINMAEMCL